jgi:hypothetical protein
MCYRWRRSVRQPVQRLSELREIAGVALLSVVSNAVAVGVVGAWRAWQPSRAVDVGRLIREPNRYATTHYRTVAWWAVLTLVLACVVGIALAALADASAQERSWTHTVVGWLRGSRDDDVTTEPAWWFMFASRPDEDVYAGCELDDGRYVGGWVYSFSAESDETENREIVLTEPETRDGSGNVVAMEASAVVVSARRLQFVTVTYVPVVESAV